MISIVEWKAHKLRCLKFPRALKLVNMRVDLLWVSFLAPVSNDAQIFDQLQDCCCFYTFNKSSLTANVCVP